MKPPQYLSKRVRVAAPGRWWQLTLGVICMSMIANLQYGWTLFVNPIEDKHHWGLPAIQVAFTIFVVVETWLVPLEGYAGRRVRAEARRRRVGHPRRARRGSSTRTPTRSRMLYLGAIVGGIGAGGVYGACVGNALKWFPDRRGLAAGITAMGFGAGSALTVYPIANMIQSQGYEAAFLKFGIAQGARRVPARLVAQGAGRVREGDRRRAEGRDVRRREYTPTQMLRSPPFWVMYVMFVLTATGGLIATAQLKPIAKDFGIANAQASLLGTDGDGAAVRAVDEPRAQWRQPAVLRLDVGSHRPREHDVRRVRARGRRASCSWPVRREPDGVRARSRVSCSSPTARSTASSRRRAPTRTARSSRRRTAGLLYTAKGTASLLVPLSSVIAANAAAGTACSSTHRGDEHRRGDHGARRCSSRCARDCACVRRRDEDSRSSAPARSAAISAGGCRRRARTSRSSRAARISPRFGRNGMRVIGEDGTETSSQGARAVRAMREAGPQDVVLLTVKAHQVARRRRRSRSICCHDDTTIVTMQNGIPWWYFHKHGGEYEGTPSRSPIPTERSRGTSTPIAIIGSVVYPAATLVAPGVVQVVEGQALHARRARRLRRAARPGASRRA